MLFNYHLCFHTFSYQIEDPNATKPADWVDAPEIPDPKYVKPKYWDDRRTIPNPKYTDKQPEDWDEAKKGKWVPPPKTIGNPNFMGLWRPRMIKNPAYKGKWTPPKVLSPKWRNASRAYIFNPIQYVGIDVYQLRAGSIFDNIFVGDDIYEWKEFADRTFSGVQEAEKHAYEVLERDTYQQLSANIRYKLHRKERELLSPEKPQEEEEEKEEVDLPDVDEL